MKKSKSMLKEGVEVDHTFLKSFLKDAIVNPRKFYSLLLLSGMKSAEAYRIIYNLKYPRLTSASFETKMKMLALLQNIITLITKDRILYSRLRSLAMNGELEYFGKDVVPSSAYSKHAKNFKIDDIDENSEGPLTSYTGSDIAGISSNGAADLNPVISKIAMMLRRAKKSKKPCGGGSPNIIIHGP